MAESTFFHSDVLNSFYQITLVAFGLNYGGYVGYFFLCLGIISVPIVSNYRATKINELVARASSKSPKKKNISFPVSTKQQSRRKHTLDLPSSRRRTLGTMNPSTNSLFESTQDTQSVSNSLSPSTGSPGSVQQFAQLPLTIRDLTSSNFDPETASIVPPNSKKPVEVDNENFKGSCIIKLRTDPLDATYAPYFEGKNRTFEFQIQGKFKANVDRDHKIWFGIELRSRLSMGLIGRAIMNTVLALCEKLIGGIHSSWGTKDNTELAHLVFPLESTIDRLVITKPGEEVPPLCVGMLPEPIDKKARSTLDHEWSTENTYSISMHGMYVDFVKWAAVNFPGKRTIDIKTLLGDMPLRLVAYSVPKASTKAHVKAEKKYLFAFEFEHSGGEVEWIDETTSVGNYSTVSSVIPAEALNRANDDVVSSLENVMASREFAPNKDQPLVSISCPMYVMGAHTSRGVWFVVKYRGHQVQEDNCERWSVLRSLTSLRDLPELHKRIHGSSNGFPDWSFKHVETENAFAHCSLSTHSIELVREDIGDFLSKLLRTPEGSKTLAYFLDENYDSQSSLLSGTRKELDMTISYNLGAVSAEGVVGRAICETRWVETWAVCYSSHLCFYSKKNKKYEARISLADVLKVEKMNDTPFPAAFLNVATVGRLYYFAFDSKSRRDKWHTKISAQVSVTQASLGEPGNINDIAALQEAYAHRSRHRWSSERTLMNERQMYFGNITREVEETHPCSMMQDILGMVLNLDADSPKEKIIEYLDAASKLKMIPYNYLLKFEPHETISFFTNMYHCLFAHSLLIFGAPSHSSRNAFFLVNSFECAGSVFSLSEIEHAILRGSMPLIKKPVKCSSSPKKFSQDAPEAALVLKHPDNRLKLILHWGTSSYGQSVPIYSHDKDALDSQLNKTCQLIVDEAIKVNQASKSVTLPRAFESFLGDYNGSKVELFLGILPFSSDSKKEEVNPIMEGLRDRKISFTKADPPFVERLSL